jgi:hypothetical protein
MGANHRSRGRDDLFRLELGLTEAGSVRIQFRAAPPARSLYGNERKLAALIYDLAAEIERRLDESDIRWAVSPEPFHARLDIELSEGEEADVAAEFVAGVLSDFDLPVGG